MNQKIDTAYRQRLYHKAAQWYLKSGDDSSARRFFYECGDFDGILSALEADGSIGYSSNDLESLKKYMTECSEGIKASHHYAMLKFALPLIIHNELELFGKVCQEAAGNITADTSLSDELRNQLLGELELLLSLTAFNNLKKMSAHHLKAWDLLKRATSIYTSKIHWSFGSPSILYLYYRESGRLAEHVQDLIENLACYGRLTNGHGSGGNTSWKPNGISIWVTWKTLKYQCIKPCSRANPPANQISSSALDFCKYALLFSREIWG